MKLESDDWPWWNWTNSEIDDVCWYAMPPWVIPYPDDVSVVLFGFRCLTTYNSYDQPEEWKRLNHAATKHETLRCGYYYTGIYCTCSITYIHLLYFEHCPQSYYGYYFNYPSIRFTLLHFHLLRSFLRWLPLPWPLPLPGEALRASLARLIFSSLQGRGQFGVMWYYASQL